MSAHWLTVRLHAVENSYRKQQCKSFTYDPELEKHAAYRIACNSRQLNALSQHFIFPALPISLAFGCRMRHQIRRIQSHEIRIHTRHSSNNNSHNPYQRKTVKATKNVVRLRFVKIQMSHGESQRTKIIHFSAALRHIFIVLFPFCYQSPVFCLVSNLRCCFVFHNYLHFVESLEYFVLLSPNM